MLQSRYCIIMSQKICHTDHIHLYAMKQVKVFPKREALHLIYGNTPTKVSHTFGNIKNGRSGYHQLQV